MAEIKFAFNTRLVKNKIEKYTKRKQIVLDAQIVTDTDQFVPYQTSALLKSVLPFIGKGELVYNTEYARKLYYNPQYNFNKVRSAHAGGQWFENAKKIYKKSWIRILNKG